MERNEVVSTAFNGLSYISAFVQENEILQIIGFILSLLTSLVLIAYRMWKWWKEATADGKIDKEEAKQLLGVIIEGAEEVKDKIEQTKGDK